LPKTLQDGDTLIVWKLDRLAHSVRDLVSMLDDFHQRGIHFLCRYLANSKSEGALLSLP